MSKRTSLFNYNPKGISQIVSLYTNHWCNYNIQMIKSTFSRMLSPLRLQYIWLKRSTNVLAYFTQTAIHTEKLCKSDCSARLYHYTRLQEKDSLKWMLLYTLLLYIHIHGQVYFT